MRINKSIIFAFIALFVTSPYFIYISFQTRMYCPGLLLMCISIYFLIQYLRSNKIKYAYLGLLIDFAGFFTIYGYFFYLVASSLVIFRYYFNHHKIPLIFRLANLILASFILLGNFILRRENIRDLISWIPHPNITDLVTLPANLLGYSQPTPNIWPVYIYYLVSLIFLVFFIYLIMFSIKATLIEAFIPNIINNLRQDNPGSLMHHVTIAINRLGTDQFVLLTILTNLLTIPIVIIVSAFQSISVLLPRQLFSVSLMSNIGFAFIINKKSNNRSVFRIVYMTIIVLLGIYSYQFYRTWYPYNPTYTDPISNYNKDRNQTLSKWVFEDDLIALYYVCGASSFNQLLITQSCRYNTINILNPKIFDNVVLNLEAKEGNEVALYVSSFYFRGAINSLNINRCKVENNYTLVCRLKDF